MKYRIRITPGDRGVVVEADSVRFAGGVAILEDVNPQGGRLVAAFGVGGWHSVEPDGEGGSPSKTEGVCPACLSRLPLVFPEGEVPHLPEHIDPRLAGMGAVPSTCRRSGSDVFTRPED